MKGVLGAEDTAGQATVAADPTSDHTRLRRLAPKPPTATPASGGTSTVPDDVAAEQVRRLSAFALVAGGLWAMGLFMDGVVFRLVLGLRPTPAALFIEACGVAAAIATYAWVRYSRQSAQDKSDAGLWLMLLNSADIALLETWANDPTTATVGHLSWGAVVILLSAMIVPSSPRKMLFAALASASMGPLGVWLAHLRGIDTPGPLLTMLMYFPTYSCALAAVVPSRMFQTMGRRLREARDLGSYELVERLGEGGMGEVWRARHRLLARPAAIKLVRPAMLGGGDDAETRLALRRFESEAQATAALTSPHTIRLYDFGAADDGRFYYVMELLEGRDMATMVQETGPMPVARVRYLLEQVCHSLAEAHARGMVHRDIKPANIFVCRMGLDYDVVKVLDFGLVQQARREPAHDLTQSLASIAALESVVGTPAFMAPESLSGDRPVDHRADLYAVGCVAYYLLTGQHVFHGRTPLQALIDHVSTPPSPPSARAGQAIPPWLDALVLSCLAKDPLERPASAEAIRQQLAMHAGSEKWTIAQAQSWWQTHLPAHAAGVAAPERAATTVS
jgi:tRNA A-37 threonylcarbamoyl transferase component Bud32